MTFVDACLKGDAKPGDIDDWVEKWHKGQYKQPLHQWLGFSLTEYMDWVVKPSVIDQILKTARIRIGAPQTKKKYDKRK